jgi:hypothetical protein
MALVEVGSAYCVLSLFQMFCSGPEEYNMHHYLMQLFFVKVIGSVNNEFLLPHLTLNKSVC